jgi:predicted amidohydrolase YtcJ
VQDQPIADAEPLPGRFVLPGLADAHAHPAVTIGSAGFVPLDADGARANLVA